MSQGRRVKGDESRRLSVQLSDATERKPACAQLVDVLAHVACHKLGNANAGIAALRNGLRAGTWGNTYYLSFAYNQTPPGDHITMQYSSPISSIGPSRAASASYIMENAQL